ncbi:uncharacterized protein LOC134543029 [Bacillus rossius redtenbacheri]|uniref:uncharacterized protein LOC134543029 n=1 Tax=Bacillus rossius redtenbacheri TaxID=93214 RepID=UPI002FDE46CA
MVSGDESWSRGGERPGSWKRSASDTCLDAISSPRSKRRRDEELEGGGRRTDDDVSSFSSDTPPEAAPMDADRRDFLQMALDQICELQRKMRDEEDSDGDADVEIGESVFFS